MPVVPLRLAPGSDGDPPPRLAERLSVLQGNAAQGRDDKNFAAAPRAKYAQRIARYVAEKELLFRSPAAARRQQLGYGRGIAAGWERREGCAEAGAAAVSPLPLDPFAGLWGARLPCGEFLKSAGA